MGGGGGGGGEALYPPGREGGGWWHCFPPSRIGIVSPYGGHYILKTEGGPVYPQSWEGVSTFFILGGGKGGVTIQTYVNPLI